MYLAELHGKLSQENENREDILTSNVFSFFKYADRKVFLHRFLKQLGLNVSTQDAETAEFFFWPSFADGTEPDLVIIVGRYYLLVEAKYHSGFGRESGARKHQLKREIEGGCFEAENQEKEFLILAVTAHYSISPELQNEVPTEYRHAFRWTNWQNIAFLIDQVLQSEAVLHPETRLFATDLYRLLVHKRLRAFEGIQAFQTFLKISRPPNRLFFDSRTAAYRGSLIGFHQAFEVFPRLHPLPIRSLFYRSYQRRGYFESLINGGPYFPKKDPDPIFFSRRIS